MAEPELREASAFAKYLESRKVLIVDRSAVARSGLFKVFQELGAPTRQVLLASSHSAAEATIAEEKPHVVVAEYDLGKRCGLELLQSQREFRPKETKDMLFVIVTGNSSQTAVARAAEEDVDAFILKPYTPETVRKTIMQAAIAKIRPSEYQVAIEQAKTCLAKGELDEADAHLDRASKLDPAPALACYYKGQVQALRRVLEQAQGSYKRGLGFNRIHYKCLIGLYELFVGQADYERAYEVVKRVSQYFPANPKRLAEVLRLAVVTGQYEDIEKYYQIFTNIDERDETLIRYVCAALVVCGKYYLGSNLGHARALELFQKAAATGQGRVKVLREVVLALLDHSLGKEAQVFLGRFPPESQGTDEYLVLRFLVEAAAETSGNALEQGRELLARGVTDERFYTVLLTKLCEASRPSMAIDDVLAKAMAACPNKVEHFQAVVARARGAKS